MSVTVLEYSTVQAELLLRICLSKLLFTTWRGLTNYCYHLVVIVPLAIAKGHSK